MTLEVKVLNIQGLKWKDEQNKDEQNVEGILQKLICEPKGDPDLIVLTEVNDKQCEDIKEKEKEKYCWIESDKWKESNNWKKSNKIAPDHYHIVVGVKDVVVDKESIEAIVDKSTKSLDLLQVRFKAQAKEQFFTVIGCRFTTGDKKCWEQYNSEGLAFFTTLLPFIQKSIDAHPTDIFILAGDFNNAQCYGDLNKRYNKEDYFNCKKQKDCYQINYNLNLIKDWLEPYGFQMADIGEEQKRNDITTYGKKTTLDKKKYDQKIKSKTFECKKADYDYPDDHIFVRGLNSQETSCDITPIPANLSDHAILWAEFDLS